MVARIPNTVGGSFRGKSSQRSSTGQPGETSFSKDKMGARGKSALPSVGLHFVIGQVILITVSERTVSERQARWELSFL